MRPEHNGFCSGPFHHKESNVAFEAETAERECFMTGNIDLQMTIIFESSINASFRLQMTCLLLFTILNGSC